jgi:hypothetical protein
MSGLPTDMTDEEKSLVESCLSILNKKTALTSEQQEKFEKKAIGALRRDNPMTAMYKLLMDTLQETFGKEDLIKNIDKLEQHMKDFEGENSEFNLLLKDYIKKKQK